MTGLPFNPALAGMHFNYGDQRGMKANRAQWWSSVFKRDQPLKTTKPSPPQHGEWRLKFTVLSKTVRQAGLILLLAEKSILLRRIMTSATNRYPDFRLQSSLPPSRSAFVWTSDQWHWEFV